MGSLVTLDRTQWHGEDDDATLGPRMVLLGMLGFEKYTQKTVRQMQLKEDLVALTKTFPEDGTVPGAVLEGLQNFGVLSSKSECDDRFERPMIQCEYCSKLCRGQAL